MSGKMVLFPDETHNLSDLSGNQAELPDECIIIGKRLTEKVNMTDQSASYLYIWLHWEDGRDCGGLRSLRSLRTLTTFPSWSSTTCIHPPPLNLYATDNANYQAVGRNGNRCQCLCQDVERKNVCQGMVFRSTVACHPPLSGYSAPEGHFPAQRLGGQLSNRVLIRQDKKRPI